MRSFDVPVRNEFTGEIRIIQVSSGHEVDAQLLALRHVFQLDGWRKAIALRPVCQPVEAEA